MKALVHELRLALIALQFLTRVPVPSRVGYSQAWLQASARHFPLVGAAVGSVAALVLWTAAALWPVPVAVLLSMAATLALTGAFHEDGLADTFDALGGAVPRAQALAIMKDSRLGTYGTVALVTVLAIKACALVAMDVATACAALLLGHALSRTVPVALIHSLPYGGDAEAAKAKPLATQIGGAGLAVAMAWAVAVGAALGAAGTLTAWALGVAVAAALAVFWWVRRWLRERLGGFTGDTLGAAQQLAEVAIYLALLAVQRVAG
jgi:adenosylcobinamide-GDP ribazoletransferase